MAYAHAANPVVNTTIAVSKTGTGPFDSGTWDGSNINTAGTDESNTNNVVRMQDTIEYRVEVSVNDSDVDDLTATVHAINGQTWVRIPSGCMTKSSDVINQPVSFISQDKTELFCNMGPAVEGTVRAFNPVALVKGIDPEQGTVILNDTTVSAEVSAGANGNNSMASDTSEETIVTADFKVDLQKALKVEATDPVSGAPYYVSKKKRGPSNEDGILMEYTIRAKYMKGSMIANGADEANGDFTADYEIVDVFTDDNDNNNVGSSSGGKLYTWGNCNALYSFAL